MVNSYIWSGFAKRLVTDFEHLGISSNFLILKKAEWLLMFGIFQNSLLMAETFVLTSQERKNRPLSRCRPVNGGLNALDWRSAPGCPWSSPGPARACSQSAGLWGAAADTRVHLKPSVTALTLNSIWPSPLRWKASWLCALRHLHIHLKGTERASLFPEWTSMGLFPLPAPTRYQGVT